MAVSRTNDSSAAGIVNGYAPLNSSLLIPAQYIPVVTGARYPYQVVSGSSSSTNSKAITVTAPTSGHKILLCTLNEGTSSVTSVTQTNVTWSNLLIASAGVAPVIELWLGTVSASAGTTCTIAFSGTSFCNGVYTEWDNLTGTVNASDTRHVTTDATGSHAIPIVTASNFSALTITAGSTTSNGTQFSAFSGRGLVFATTSTLGIAYGFLGLEPSYGFLTGGSSATSSGLTAAII